MRSDKDRHERYVLGCPSTVVVDGKHHNCTLLERLHEGSRHEELQEDGTSFIWHDEMRVGGVLFPVKRFADEVALLAEALANDPTVGITSTADELRRLAKRMREEKEHAKHLYRSPGVPMCGRYGPNESILLDADEVTCIGCLERARAELDAAREVTSRRQEVEAFLREPEPVPIRLHCPACGTLHVDEGEFATRPHHTHACQECGETWRPAIVPTVGVRFLPGFRNEERRT